MSPPCRMLLRTSFSPPCASAYAAALSSGPPRPSKSLALVVLFDVADSSASAAETKEKKGLRRGRMEVCLPACARVDVAALGQWDLPVIACAGGGGAVGYLGAGELVFHGLVDAGFGCC